MCLDLDTLATLGTLVAASCAAISACYSKKALEAGNKPILAFKTAVTADIEKDGYRINILLENVGNGPANIMVVDAVGNGFNKVNIGVPNIVVTSGQSEISIWLSNCEKRNKVAIAVYYWDIIGNKVSVKYILT